jgi:thioredoxin reductase (NADPH)
MAEEREPNAGETYDCLIVGGGPAGLTAAAYLARFRRKLLVLDAGQSRAKFIPATHNCPGFPDGIAGVELLDRLRRQSLLNGAVVVEDVVRKIRREGPDFVATASAPIRARTVLIATGIVDTLPNAPDTHDMIKAGTLRLCPICDAFEVIDKRIAVMGPMDQALKKALFMRTYSNDVTLLVTNAETPRDRPTEAILKKAGIKIEACVESSLRSAESRSAVTLVTGEMQCFDTIYVALGCRMRSKLAVDLGAVSDDAGNLVVDSRQRTAIEGLYAAGDVVDEINQLAVAFGHAAIAATDMHNYLEDARG